MDWSVWKKAFEPYLSAPLLLTVSIVAGIAIFAFSWWLRGHILDEHLKFLQSQRHDLNAKLSQAKAKLLDLEKQLAAGASRIMLSDHVIATATLLADMQKIINNMEGTL